MAPIFLIYSKVIVSIPCELKFDYAKQVSFIIYNDVCTFYLKFQNFLSAKEYNNDLGAFLIEWFLALGISKYNINSINSIRIYFMEKVNLSLRGFKLIQVIKTILRHLFIKCEVS